MKIASFALVVVPVFMSLISLPAHAASGQLSAKRLNVLDRNGCFTPAFKDAVHRLVKARDEVAQTKAEQLKLSYLLPDLKKQVAEADAKTVLLREELTKYDHPEELDFIALQEKMNDSKAPLHEQLALAQAYVWAYSASPHQADAQQYLAQTQKKIADQRQADQDAETARVAARAKLVERAQAHNLSLNEWKDFLQGMSEGELLKYLGHPDSQNGDYWIYSGAWLPDPTGAKVGKAVHLEAGRVLNVSPAVPPQ
jgi:hypothetical protein